MYDYISSCDDVLEPGDHVAVSRGTYVHHCVYLGSGTAVHLTLDGIVETDMDDLVRKRSFWVIDHNNAYPPDVIVERARSKLYGDEKYNLIFHNCENFCEWCCTGFSWSHQVFGSMAVGWFFGPIGHVIGQLVNYGTSRKYRLSG